MATLRKKETISLLSDGDLEKAIMNAEGELRRGKGVRRAYVRGDDFNLDNLKKERARRNNKKFVKVANNE